jgi:hypothetical protein
LFMHFLGVSHDGLVARRVDLDTISSSVCSTNFINICIETSLANRGHQELIFGSSYDFLRAKNPRLYLKTSKKK